MKAKKYLLGIFLFLFAPSFAQQVSLETAQCVADIFLRNNMSAAMRSASATHITTSSASVIKPIGKVAQSPVMYAVSQDSVWVLISADERVTPILAYSDANAGTFPEYNDMPEGMIALLDWYEEQIQYLRDSTNITTIHEGWRTYQAASNTAKTEIIVPPLLQRNGERILWKQSGLNQGASSSDKCYNKFCPLTSEGKRSIVGCVAVAMGQVMWYWQWPKIAFVKDDNQRTLIREYNWDYMPARLQNSTPIEHIDMVANLLHDAGVSVNMTYTDSLSGAYSAVIPDALRSVFGYNADAIKYRTSNNTVWLNLLKDNLQKGYPVLYSGYRIKDKGGKDGHQFVLDGYNSDDAFHINYGWGGSQNGYYILETIANKPFVYYSSQSAILNVYPNYPDCSPREVLLSTKRNNNIHEERFPKIWIEGLGSMDGIVHNNATLLEGSGISVLLCAYHNDECRYTTDNPKYISLGCIYNEGDMINSVETVTTPNSSAQKIMHNGQLFILLNGKTYNVMGVEVEK